MWVSFYECSVEKKEDALIICSNGIFSPPKYGHKFDLQTRYTIYSDLTFDVNVTITPKQNNLPYLPRFGVRIGLSPELNSVDWYGYGPNENYPDCLESAVIGRYGMKITDLHTDYIRPQRNGTRTGVREFALITEQGTGLKITAIDNHLNFTVADYTIENLQKATHREKLKRGNITELCIDGHICGAGSNSCGPPPDPKYLLYPQKDKPISFTFKVNLI